MALAYSPQELLPNEVPSFQSMRRLFTCREYHQAAELGIFSDDERLELINGEVINKVSPQGSRHWVSVTKTLDSLKQCFGEKYCVVDEKPVQLSENSEPEPDILVCRGAVDDYSEHLPMATDVVLIVEISDSSLQWDRTFKSRLYSDANIPEYWIVNLNDRRLEVYRDPTIEVGYRLSVIYPEDTTVSPLSAPEISLPVSAFFPLKRPE